MYRSSSYDVSLPQNGQDCVQRYSSVVNQLATRASEDIPVVVVRNAYKSFSGDKLPVLEDFSMTVRKGTIYSLLGSSGCGKTTTLSCIVGVQKLKTGSIFVFGSAPGGSELSRSRIGYMPQDISLYGDFSIAENLNYFGTLCGMDKYFVASQIFYMTKLLRLPPLDRRVGSLSGGQRRRVSFAAALIHEPELLLLDEPTTGVDPLLREKIWDHLISLTKTKRTTILLTTHYIDEAKPSQTVGVMRGGRLIAEDNPIHLLERYNTTSLETVFLNLCKERNPPPQAIEYFVNYGGKEKKSNRIQESVTRVKALVVKNTVIMLRNLFMLLFVTVIPAAMVLTIGVASKHDPMSIKVGVLNFETDFYTCFDPLHQKVVEGECNLEDLGCQFLQHIPSENIELKNYATADDAIEDVQKGKISGFLTIPEDYSNSFYEFVTSGGLVDDYVLNNSQIIVRLDKTTLFIAGSIEKIMYDTLNAYTKKILMNCGFDPRQVEYPLQFSDPVFGSDKDNNMLDSVAPSFGLMMIIFFPVLSSSIRFIGEKKDGTLGRSLVSGTNIWEIVVAYTVSEFALIVAQGGLVLICLRVVIGRGPVGSFELSLIMCIMIGVCGMTFGFLMGITLSEEIEAGLLAMAIFFPNIFLSGSMWPAESMPAVMRYVCAYLPCTMSTEAFRSIFNRGWDFTHPVVWSGFLVISVYISGIILVTIIIHRMKTNL